MGYDGIVFDLDGTLWDTSESCAIAWNRALAAEGISYRTIVADDVRAVTGKPHEECIRITFADLAENQVRRLAEATATEDNRVIEERGGILYPGVAGGLERLRQRFSLSIVSNCQAGYIETFLRLNPFEALFSDFECWGNTGQTKGSNLASVIRRNHLASPIMVGDAEGDETAARECGIPFAFAEYGFGEGRSPDFSFSSFTAFVDFAMQS